MQKKSFGFFSYRYGNNLATAQVIYWLISMNILSLLIAIIEFYAYTDAAKNHINESAGIYVGCITGIVLWVFDQWVIATDTTEFERLGKTSTLNASMWARAVIFVVSIGATSYFLYTYLSKSDAAQEIDKHNQGLIIKINNKLESDAKTKDKKEEQLFNDNKKKTLDNIKKYEDEIEGYKKSLENKQSGYLKSKNGNLVRTNRNPIPIETCKKYDVKTAKYLIDTVNCHEISKQKDYTERDLSNLKDTEKSKYQNPFVPTSHPQPIILTKDSEIPEIKEKYCLESDCDFWFLTKTENRKQALKNIDTSESWVLSAIVMSILAAVFLMFKVLQPEEVKDYYNSLLQGYYQNYRNGLYNDIIDEKEHYTNATMDSARFKQWISEYDEASHQAYKRYITGVFNDILNENELYTGQSRMSFASFKIWFNTYDEKLHQKYSHDYLQGLLDDYILDENEYPNAAVPMDFLRFKDWYANEYPVIKANYERTKEVNRLKREIKLIDNELEKSYQNLEQINIDILKWQMESESHDLALTSQQVVMRELNEKITSTQQQLNALLG